MGELSEGPANPDSCVCPSRGVCVGHVECKPNALRVVLLAPITHHPPANQTPPLTNLHPHSPLRMCVENALTQISGIMLHTFWGNL